MTEFFLDGDGGLFMWPILFVFIVGMGICGERLHHLSRTKNKSRNMWDLLHTVLVGEFDKPRTVISKDKSTISQMMGMGLARQGVVRPREDVEGMECVKKL
jgi:biopolymer transport protein ExbB